jgi:catechol 2,3-dioxygenase-like lactoylglutathione lyase family enzyme
MHLFRIFAACLIAVVTASAQLPGRGPRNVAMGPIYVDSADPDKAIAFWTDVIGATADSHGSVNGVSMQGATILFNRMAATGPSAGSVIDHIGVTVPDLQPFIERMAKTGYKSFQPSADRLMIDGPDGVRIELTEDSSNYAALQFDHIHFYTTQPKEMQAWYAKNFAARTGRGERADSSNLGQTALYWSHADSAAPTAGRAIDRLSLEIRGLEAFCKNLTDNGVKLDAPYSPGKSVFLTDPWGMRIELTEASAR